MSKIDIIDEYYKNDNNSYHIIIQADGLQNNYINCILQIECIFNTFDVCSFRLINIFDQNFNKKLNNLEISDAVDLSISLNKKDTKDGIFHLYIHTFYVKHYLRKSNIGLILFQTILKIVVPYYNELLGKPFKEIKQLYINGTLSTVDSNGNWLQSFPFYANLHNRVDIKQFGYSEIVTVFCDPENNLNNFKILTNDVVRKEKIRNLIEKYSETRHNKKIIFIFSQ